MKIYRVEPKPPKFEFNDIEWEVWDFLTKMKGHQHYGTSALAIYHYLYEKRFAKKHQDIMEIKGDVVRVFAYIYHEVIEVSLAGIGLGSIYNILKKMLRLDLIERVGRDYFELNDCPPVVVVDGVELSTDNEDSIAFYRIKHGAVPPERH
jgi:hypothetical protein